MEYTEAVIELIRQLKSGEATRQQYEEVIRAMETRMVEMHVTALYDVLGYQTAELTANAYGKRSASRPRAYQRGGTRTCPPP
jgi:hypothetical protein